MSQNQKDIFSGNLGLAAVIMAVIMAITAGIVFFAFGEDNYVPLKHEGNPCYLYEGNDITIMSKAPWCESWLDLQLGNGWTITSSDVKQLYLIRSIIG